MQPAHRPTLRLSFVSLAILGGLLTACGGGGGDSAPTVTVPTTTRTVPATSGADLTASDLATQGGALARAVVSVAGDGAFDVTGRSEQPQTLRAAGGAGPVHARLAKALLKRAAVTAASRERPAAVSSETVACQNVGGSMLVTINDADDNRKLSAGDSLSIQATNCVLDATLPAASGSMSLAVNAVALGSDDVPTELDATITATNFTIGTYGTFSGTIRLWSKPEGTMDRTRLSYRAVTVAVAGTSVVYDFDVYGLGNDAGGTFDLNGGLVVGGQTFAVVSEQAMSVTGSNPPSSGVAMLRDAAGDTVRLTARTASVFDLAFVPAGGTVPTATLTDLSWDDYGG